MKKRIPAILWSLFGAGGSVSAFLFPVHVFLLGLAFPLGWLESPDYEAVVGLFQKPLVRIYLFALISLPLFHSAHRIRYSLYDGLKLRHLEPFISIVCYGLAVILTLAAGGMLLSMKPAG